MSDHRPLYAGIDLGTSGVRAVCIDAELNTVASASVTFDIDLTDRRDPQHWWMCTSKLITRILQEVDSERIAGIAVDGTSGSMLPVDSHGHPVGKAMLYNDTCSNSDLLALIAKHAPESSAAHGATSGLARAIMLTRQHPEADILHEADWIACQLSGITGISDENNALKTGYDPVQRCWPEWIQHTGLSVTRLPIVQPAGTPIGKISTTVASQLGLSANTMVVSGTTDGCASFLATGASNAGDGVTVLGSTLTIKLLSDTPVTAPEFGIYSHRIGERWLAGGASNTGGAVLGHYFTDKQLADLSERINLQSDTTLDYYPLLSAGERFPINDPQLQPRLTPRPSDDTEFLLGMLQGMANIEALAYRRLNELGAPELRSLRTVGGGRNNGAWQAIRAKTVCDVSSPNASDQAAVGVASLARDGVMSNKNVANQTM